jgi:signal peptidase I
LGKLAVQRNTNINAVAVAVNAIQHFERLIEYKHKDYITRPSPVGGDEIEIKDGKIIYYEGIYFGITRGLPRHEENKYYSVLPFRYLQTLCGCLFDPKWKTGFTEDREYEQYPDKFTAHIEVEDCGLVTVKAGTFENCLKLTVTSEKDGELEKNRRYYWWSYACCGKKTFYFAPNVGVVRHECDWGNGDLVSICELSEYTSTATAGEYMPVYIGCSWVYDETTIEDAYILRKVYRVTHGMNNKFFLTSDHDFTYCGTEIEYNAMRSNDK